MALSSVDGGGADVLFVVSSWPLNLTVPATGIWACKGSIIGGVVSASIAGSGGMLSAGRRVGGSIAK